MCLLLGMAEELIRWEQVVACIRSRNIFVNSDPETSRVFVFNKRTTEMLYQQK